jgi:surface antigen
MIKWSMLVLSVSVLMSACTMQQREMGGPTTPEIFEQNELGAGVTPGVPIGGSLAANMDENDRNQLSRALDKAPGRETTWVNSRQGVTYTVTSIRKTVVHGNRLCRQYEVRATRHDETQSMQGTACVASDGAWSEVGS